MCFSLVSASSRKGERKGLGDWNLGFGNPPYKLVSRMDESIRLRMEKLVIEYMNIKSFGWETPRTFVSC